MVAIFGTISASSLNTIMWQKAWSEWATDANALSFIYLISAAICHMYTLKDTGYWP